MSASAESTFAWEPLTPRGVAAFARARFSRLLLVQFVIASLAAAAAVWFLSEGCFPTVRAAIRNLPAAGEIRAGRLDWSGHPPQILAEGRFLAFIVDPNHSGQIHSPADVQIEFGRESVRIISLLGYTEQDYPRDWIIAFNRTDLEPLWGAWEPELLAIAVLAGGGRPDAGVGGAGDDLFSAGPAHQLFCEPRFEFPRQLEAGGGGVDAGRLAADRRHCAL